jgi:hypothetical protein
VVRLGAATAFVGKKRAARTNIKGRASRHTPALDHRSDGALELARAEDDPGKVLAIWNVGQETENASRYRAMARAIRAMLTTGKDYEDLAKTAAA